MGAYVAITTFLPLYFQLAFGLDAGQSGLALVVMLVMTVVGANTTGRYMPRLKHYKRMALAGCALGALAAAGLALAAQGASLPVFLALTGLAGLGTGPVVPITTVCVQNAVDPRDLGAATSAAGFLRSLGSTVAVAALGAILLAWGDGSGGTSRTGFAAAFTRAAIALCGALGFLVAMEEKPLRGRA